MYACDGLRPALMIKISSDNGVISETPICHNCFAS